MTSTNTNTDHTITTTTANTTATAATTKQQQQQKNSSCHEECSTITTDNDELLQTTFKWMFWSPHHLVKDDVFFAPSLPSSFMSSSSTITTNNSSGWVPTPCLSPVTSPSDFLYDREPLFDGIYQEEVLFSVQEPDQCSVSLSPPNDNWSILFNNDDYYDFLPLTPSSTELEEEEEEVNDDYVYDEDDYDDDDDDEENACCNDISNSDNNKYQVMNQTVSTKKRKMDDNESTRRTKKSKKSSTATTVFENLTKMGIDWCRYCGTTEGVNWRPGPWGKRTLCNKHGCDYKGYGLASRLPRLDLSAFTKEKLQDRQRPIVQEFCVICQSPEEEKEENKLIPCQGGCSRAYHQYCHSSTGNSTATWYCSSMCLENKQKNKVVVDLPRKYLPLMRLQKKSLKATYT